MQSLKQNFKQNLAISAVCTAMGLIMACSGSHFQLPQIPPPDATTFAHIATGATSSSHIQVKQENASPLLASLLVQATPTPTPVPLSQSFDAVCTNQLDFSVVPVGSVIPIAISKAGESTCNQFISSPPPTLGKKVHDGGTVANLIVDVTLDDNSITSCENRTDTANVTDGELVQAYYEPDVAKTAVAINGTLTTVSCSVTIPQGRTVGQIEAQWTK